MGRDWGFRVFGVWGFGFRLSGFLGIRGSGFGFRVSDLGTRVLMLGVCRAVGL